MSYLYIEIYGRRVSKTFLIVTNFHRTITTTQQNKNKIIDQIYYVVEPFDYMHVGQRPQTEW